jgi:LPS export ABC transporter protein LptC
MKEKAVFFIILLFFSCTIKEKDVADNKKKPDMIQENYDHFIYKNGRKYLEAKIDKAFFYEKTQTIECNDISADIFNSKNELTTKINSDKGVINKKDKNVLFTGNVIIKSVEKKTDLLTEELTLDYQNNKMTSDKDVLFRKEDGSYLKTKSLSSEIKQQTITFGTVELLYNYEDNTEDRTDDK